MISLNALTPNGVMVEIASRVKQRRLELNLTQEGLAARAGMKLPTYRKFEQTGSIAFEKLLQVAFALDCLRDFEEVFASHKYESLDEVLAVQSAKNRKRGRKL